MTRNALAKRCLAVLALVLFQAKAAIADEIWMCAFTESSYDGDRIVHSGEVRFFLRIKPAIAEIVVSNLVRMTFSISENTQAKLIGAAHFDQPKGGANHIEIALDKSSGDVRQTGNISTKRHLSTGRCSKSATDEWPPEVQDFSLTK